MFCDSGKKTVKTGEPLDICFFLYKYVLNVVLVIKVRGVVVDNQTVLFVDDEPNMLRTIQRVFRHEPFCIVTAPNACAALNLIDGGEIPALIVSDQCMPGMTGVDFLAEAKNRLPDTIRMLLTGYADLSAAAGAINDGEIMRYLQKPWREPELLQAVRDGVERYHLVTFNQKLMAELENKNIELEDLNRNLEEKVSERTKALQEAYGQQTHLAEQLQQMVFELESRDRIQQHLLTIHPLEETIKMLLDVICQVPTISNCSVYLMRDGALKIEGEVRTFSGGVDVVVEAIHQAALCQVVRKKEWVRILKDEIDGIIPFAVIPMVYSGSISGAVLVEYDGDKDGIDDDSLETIQGFSQLASIGIRDSLLAVDMPEWETEYDDVLNTFAK